jgi:hypothetical protein
MVNYSYKFVYFTADVGFRIEFHFKKLGFVGNYFIKF